MKKIIYFSIALFIYSNSILSQTPFWTETFGTGCSQGQYAAGFSGSNGTWTVTNTGMNGIYPNNWFVSATEANTGIGNCGDGCLSNFLLDNRTLHIAFDLNNLSPGFYDFGAAYLGGAGYETDIRAQSPTINCTSQTNIVLGFSYILKGIPGADYFEVQYSANGGTNWITLSTPAPTNSTACSGQGQWTSYTLALPSSANNNANVKIGFRWQNVDANGSDPSAALDDLTLTSVAPQAFTPAFTLTGNGCVSTLYTLTANTGTFAVSGYTWNAQPAATIATPNASATTISFGTAGTYTVSLTATSGGTTATTSHTININPNPIVTALASAATCFGMCNGSVTANAGPGTYTFTFLPPGSSNTSGTLGSLCAGAYTVTATSAVTGCSTSAGFNITQPAPLTVSNSFTNGTCGACNGAISFTANGGSAPYSYSVAPGNMSANLCAGIYTITANDAGACSAVNTVTINSVSLSSSASSSSASCGTCADGSATVTFTGGTAPLSFSWSPSGGTGATAANLIPGCYTVTVSDSANCVSTSTTCVGFATGISESSTIPAFDLYPNPTTGIIYFRFNHAQERTIYISDVSGRIIARSISDKVAHEIDLSNYAGGIYFVSVENAVFKIVKH